MARRESFIFLLIVAAEPRSSRVLPCGGFAVMKRLRSARTPTRSGHRSGVIDETAMAEWKTGKQETSSAATRLKAPRPTFPAAENRQHRACDDRRDGGQGGLRRPGLRRHPRQGRRGDDHYPAPWASVKYDTGLGSYVTNVTKEQLDKAPRYGSGDKAMELRQRRAGPLPSFAVLVKQGSSRDTVPEPGF